MAHKDEFVNMEDAWKQFSEKAKARTIHSQWANEEWSMEGQQKYQPDADETAIKKPAASQLKEQSPQKPKKKWSGLIGMTAAAALVGLILFGPWGGNIMADMLKTFTVQNLQGVHVSKNQISHIENALSKATPGGKTLHIQDFGQITKFGGGQAHQLAMNKADAKLGSGLLSFPGTSPETNVMYEPGMRIHLKLKVAKVNQLLKNLGGKTTLPASMDGKTIQFVLPAVITMNQPEHQQVSLSEESVPQLNVPGDANVERVKKAVLGLPIIPDGIRQRIEGTTDWKKTFFVPLTNQADHQTTLNGHQAIIYHNNGGAVSQRALIWLANGHIYMLRGPESVFSTDQSIIDKAKEIIKHGANHSNQ